MINPKPYSIFLRETLELRELMRGGSVGALGIEVRLIQLIEWRFIWGTKT